MKNNSTGLIIPQYYSDIEVVPYWNLEVIKYYNKEVYPHSEDCQKLYNIYKQDFLACFKLHENVAQVYDDKYPYAYHLMQVMNCVDNFIPNKIKRISCTYKICLLSAALHDSIEDARMTYNDIIKFVKNNYYDYLEKNDNYVTHVADIVYALTDEKGKNRQQRHSKKYWNNLLKTPCAVFIKCCDRIANIQYSVKNGSRMYNVYIKEMLEFVEKIENADDWKLFDNSDTRMDDSILNVLKGYINY